VTLTGRVEEGRERLGQFEKTDSVGSGSGPVTPVDDDETRGASDGGGYTAQEGVP